MTEHEALMTRLIEAIIKDRFNNKPKRILMLFKQAGYELPNRREDERHTIQARSMGSQIKSP